MKNAPLFTFFIFLFFCYLDVSTLCSYNEFKVSLLIKRAPPRVRTVCALTLESKQNEEKRHHLLRNVSRILYIFEQKVAIYPKYVILRIK